MTDKRKKTYTEWGSKNAEDMYQIATMVAGFDRVELMREICRIQRTPRTVNLSTVERAMQNLYTRSKTPY